MRNRTEAVYTLRLDLMPKTYQQLLKIKALAEKLRGAPHAVRLFSWCLAQMESALGKWGAVS